MSWTEFVREHGEVILRIAFRVLHNIHDAEDVMQETLMEAFRMPNLPTTPVLRRMAAFRAIDRIRIRERRPISSLELEPQGRDDLPIDVLSKNEAADRMRHAIGLLPQQQARCFWLRYVEGESNKSIAALLSISESAVSTSLHKARTNLKAILQSQREELDLD